MKRHPRKPNFLERNAFYLMILGMITVYFIHQDFRDRTSTPSGIEQVDPSILKQVSISQTIKAMQD